jgi:hypothetical protein
MTDPCYYASMAKTEESSSKKIVRDSKSGRYVTVLGAGALKGHLTLKKGLDLTKPIAPQALKGSRRAKRDPASATG